VPFNAETASAYLAAMIDGEGTVAIPAPSNRNRVVRITNTDWGLIEAVAECCDVLCVDVRIVERAGTKRPAHWARAWDVVISKREALERLLAMVPLRSTKKLERLKAIVETYRPRRPTPAELHQWYIVEQRSFAEIMRITHAKSTGTVAGWLRRAGIKARDHSDAGLLNWKNRKGLHAVP